MTDEPITERQRRQMNNRYRDQQPSDVHQRAFERVLAGKTVTNEQRETMIDRLYKPFPDSAKELPVDPWEPVLHTNDTGNGLGQAVTRGEYRVELHISEKLYHQQPIGVLLRPINDRVRKAGEALITDVSPRSADVEDHVMPCEHFKFVLEPLPLWLEKWVGEDGYTVGETA